MRQRNSEPRGQCLAVLKWIHRTRCSRRAEFGGYLCAQHRHFGATIPTCWTRPEKNEHGVLISRPEAPFVKVKGDAASPAPPAVTHTGAE